MSKPKDKMTACVVLRDYWTDEGERVPKGRVVEVPAEAAMDGMETGILSRVKGK